eukprot:GHVL01032141.1.p2 GENE.GHVL01032141.1~~GHVL01032141.1.p2  ORF type:complete len:259 (-),score=89.62 GHVL01032141.1:1568-2278(-)
MSNVVDAKDSKSWDKLWKIGVNPGDHFDAKSASPILKTLNLPKNGHFLIPGCGRGYDLVELSTPDRTVIGLEISETAAQICEEYIKNKMRGPGGVIIDDFFTYSPKFKFDVIYDYTFFCAIHPNMRIKWSNKIFELINPGGLLVTVIYPICNKIDGPPFAVSLNIYKDILLSTGFKIIKLENLSSDQSHKGRDGTGPWNATSGIGLWLKPLHETVTHETVTHETVTHETVTHETVT